jgi:hypothetical protein
MSVHLFALAPSIANEITDREYARLVGWPRARPFESEMAALGSAARQWYSCQGRPFAAAARHSVDSIEPDAVHLQGGVTLRSSALATRLRAVRARDLAVVIVTAGQEVDDESARLWSSDRPDAAFFLDRLGAAIAESLVTLTAIALCRTAASEHLTALPPLAPGCSDWDLTDQAVLFGMFGGMTGSLSMLDSGMLRPKNSMLAVVGLTPHVLPQPYPTQAEACLWCDLSPCAFRRAPHDPARASGGWRTAFEVGA